MIVMMMFMAMRMLVAVVVIVMQNCIMRGCEPNAGGSQRRHMGE